MKHTESRAYPAQDSVFIYQYIFFCFIAACYHAAVYNCFAGVSQAKSSPRSVFKTVCACTRCMKSLG